MLVEAKEKEKYDFHAALAKALLLFLLVYGSLGGFLAALEISYNKGISMLALFALALLLSAGYQTGKRWLTNLLSIILFVFYVFIALTNYWLINSGYYAVMNRIFEKIREYLDISGGVEYASIVQDEYSTVTIFVMFLGMVGIILLNIQMQTKCNLLLTIFLTFSPYVLLFYLECTPPLIYICLLFTGYLAVAVLDSSRVVGRLSAQMRDVLPVAMVSAVLITGLLTVVVQEQMYRRVVPESGLKTASRAGMGQFARYGMQALFQRNSIGAGMSGGRLSKGAASIPNYETDLIVRYTPYSYRSMYLKAFTGKDYTGECWTEAQSDGVDDGRMEAGVKDRKRAYENQDLFQGRGILEVEYVGANKEYEYRPYYTDYDEVEQQGKRFRYTYYPVGRPNIVKGSANEEYLEVPEACREAVEEACERAGLEGDAEQVASGIMEFFNREYSYTLRPGYYYGNPDYISHFLSESKRGYCTHFASAATMMFRYMGYPARFVEGYAFSYAEVVDKGELVEGADYAEYFDGYSDIGETALIELEIMDADAHAWVEVYVDGAGWVVVDPTPQTSQEEERTSFWEAFRGTQGPVDSPDLERGDFGQVLENAVSGVSYLLVGMAAVALILLLARFVYGQRKLRGLDERSKICLHYVRLLEVLRKKDKYFVKQNTLRSQIAFLKEIYGINISAEQEKALYEAFFGTEISYDCDRLCKELAKDRRMFKRACIPGKKNV